METRGSLFFIMYMIYEMLAIAGITTLAIFFVGLIFILVGHFLNWW